MELEQARKLLGWTQGKLAAEADKVAQRAGEKAGTITGGTISDIELGRSLRPSYVLVMRIMQALHKGGLAGVKPEDIFPIDEPVGGRR